MKIGTCWHEERRQIFVVKDDDAVLPRYGGLEESSNSLLSVIARGPQAFLEVAACADRAPSQSNVPLNELLILPPIPRPSKNVICLGWNYSEHIKESAQASGRGDELPEYPVVFTKSPTAVIGSGGKVPYDKTVTEQLDWEVELGVIIGRLGKGISRSRALQHVVGYTIINDLSARDLQFRHKQFFIGKSLDGSCPIGPWMVTADEIKDPHDLDLKCWVNGVIKQDSNTRYMIFDIPSIIETLSKGMTLEPGDIIATGTPSGVGFARQPPEFLRPGDTVECEIESIGKLNNTIADNR